MARYEVYKDKDHDYRWRFVSTNGRIIAESSEGYRSKSDCERGIEILQTEGVMAVVDDMTALQHN